MKIVPFLLATSLIWGAQQRFDESFDAAWIQSFAVTKTLCSEKSPPANLSIFENPTFGKVLAIDGVIQTTEKDEAIYHEMLVHTPLLSHGKVKSVLIIGGGDGGTLREVLRHSSVKKAILVEIDARVIDLCKQYLPSLSQGAFEDPRATLVVSNAFDYLKQTKETFDVILCDSTDPTGAATSLFSREFYKLCKDHLSSDGIFVSQNGIPFLQPREIHKAHMTQKELFRFATLYTASVPSYTGGLMTFSWASNKKHMVSEKQLSTRMQQLPGKMVYYTPAVHRAAFSLPQYILDLLEKDAFAATKVEPSSETLVLGQETTETLHTHKVDVLRDPSLDPLDEDLD